MFNATTLKKLALCFGASLLLCSCGGKEENPEAVMLYNSAKANFEANNPNQAINTIDSLAKAFPKEISVQRRAMHLRTLADSLIIDREFLQLDSTLIADSITFVNLKPQFAFVKTADMVEGYYIDKSLQGTPLYERTGIEPRVDESGNIFIASCLFGPVVKHTSLTASCAAGEVATGEVPYDEALNYRYQAERGNCEMVTFNFDKCSDFSKFIAENCDSEITIRFVGAKTHNMKLSSKLAKTIADTYYFSSAMSSGKNATAKKMFMAKKRELNNKQINQTRTEL